MSEAKREINHPDPSALGLFGLAMVTWVASTQKLDLTHGLSFAIPWAIFLGAGAQLIAGILDYKKGNVFGATAFCGYGLFWLGVVMSWLISLGAFGETLTASANLDTRQLGVAFVGYLIFTLFLTVGALETNKVLFVIFVLIDVLFVGLSLTSFGIMPEVFHKVAAVSEMLIALLSFYAAGANVLNNHFGRAFLPIGKPFGVIAR
jgi:succinate-acetate transporter protein